jgi:hypothetical protein
MHPFFLDNLNSGAYIVSKELNQDPELFNSYYRMSTGSFSLLVDLVRPEIRRKDTNFHTAVSAVERLLIALRYIFCRSLNKYNTIARRLAFTLL